MSAHTTSIQRAILMGQLATIVPMLLIIYIPGFAFGFLPLDRFTEAEFASSYQKFILQFILIEAIFILLAISYRRYALKRWREWAFSVVVDQEGLREAAIKKRLMKETDSIPFDPLQWSSIKSDKKSSSSTASSAEATVDAAPHSFDSVHATSAGAAFEGNTNEASPSDSGASSVNESEVGELTIIRKTKQFLETRLVIYCIVAAWGAFNFESIFGWSIFILLIGFSGLIGIGKCLLNDRVYILVDNQGIRINNIDNLTSGFDSRGRSGFGLGGTTRADWADITEISFANKRIYITCNQYFDAAGTPVRRPPQQNFGISNCDLSMDAIEKIVGIYQRRHSQGQHSN